MGRWLQRVLALAVLVSGVVVAPADVAGAAELTTTYPTVVVGAGDSITLDLKVTSSRRERVGLAVVESPRGWTARLQGGGFTIGAVYTDPSSPPAVQLVVRVPGDAAPGTGRVVVRATAPSGSQDLPLELTVAEGVAGAAGLEAEFPRLRGSTTDTFRFDLTLRNDGSRAVTFGLEATGPEGWQVTARPAAQQQAATVTVEPGTTAPLQVEADPPDGAKAGTYPITVRATGGGRPLATELAAEIIGDVQLSLATASERLNARGRAGSATSVALVVRNEGTAPVENVTLSASPPSGWEVTFQPATVAAVAPGKSVQVTANIRPGGDAVSGDYSVSVTAAGSGKTASVDLRFAVQTSFGWGVVGVAVILASLGGLFWVFRRFGRR